MTYKEHIARRPASPYPVGLKIFTAIEGLLAVICFLVAMPMVIFTVGPTALVIGPIYVLTLGICLTIFAVSKKPRRGLHLAICIQFSLPILTAITYLILIGTGFIPIC